jgi:large subunit ribosomal protein L3
VFRVDVERGLILVRGAVPGAEGGFVKIRDAVKHPAPKGAPTPGAVKQTAAAAPPEAASDAEPQAESGGEA